MPKIPIWGEKIPYNVPGKNKLDVMTVKKRTPLFSFAAFITSESVVFLQAAIYEAHRRSCWQTPR